MTWSLMLRRNNKSFGDGKISAVYCLKFVIAAILVAVMYDFTLTCRSVVQLLCHGDLQAVNCVRTI